MVSGKAREWTWPLGYKSGLGWQLMLEGRWKRRRLKSGSGIKVKRSFPIDRILEKKLFPASSLHTWVSLSLLESLPPADRHGLGDWKK